MAYTSPGRPSMLTKSTQAELKELYCNNIPVTEVARHYNISRQLVYYYFKKFTLEGIAQHQQPTIAEVLNHAAA